MIVAPGCRSGNQAIDRMDKKIHAGCAAATADAKVINAVISGGTAAK